MESNHAAGHLAGRQGGYADVTSKAAVPDSLFLPRPICALRNLRLLSYKTSPENIFDASVADYLCADLNF